MTVDAIDLVKNIQPNPEGVEKLADYLGLELEKIESVSDAFEDDTIFGFRRPNGLDGAFAYVTFTEKLKPNTRANQYHGFFNIATQVMKERGQTSSEVDFIIVIGEGTLIVFDSADYRRRLILTPEKLERDHSKYLTKFESLKSESLLANKVYVEDEFFGDTELDQNFKNELFRFAIADDEQFINKTRIIRLNFWRRIREDSRCKAIIKNIFFKDQNNVDTESNYYGDVVSAVLDTLVLRYILVRILERRFGYDNELAKKTVAKVGLGTSMSIDKLLESKVHFDHQEEQDAFDSKTGVMDLFKLEPTNDFDKESISEIQEAQPKYMVEEYGGDLYVSEIAKAATQIEGTLTESEYALIWNVTSSTDLDFDLEDVTPGTIGEQYEQTLQMKLEKNAAGEWEYSKDNSLQKSQGSFYTNSKITDYIVDQTLGKKLDQIKKELIEASNAQREKLLRSVLKLRMADITSGGGTFLAGAVRKLGSWYSELERKEEIKPLLQKIKGLETESAFQKYAVNNMIYGVDMDLKALIVSSFALTLESLGDVQEKLPELINKTLIHQNSVISLVPESKKQTYFNTYKNEIKELYQEKKKWISKKKNKFYGVRENLQNTFAKLMAEELESKKYSKESLLQLFKDKHMEVLEFNLPEVFFNKDGEYVGGFDVIFGNPPYIQLQKKEIFSDEEKYVYKELGEFKSYEATGDIYALFYERGLNLLKEDGLLGFITSNKFLRAGYGKSLRNYFLENTNPLLLVNLGSGMFGATVDTCILIVEKCENKDMLKAVDLAKRASEPKARLENMSDYIEQNTTLEPFGKNESWLILSSIERSIKKKVEKNGIPLKDWDIQIYRGVLTGYNKAFIIDEKRKNELILEDPKSAEIIRPILRGRDIDRYGYKFADLYLICTFPAKNLNIDDFPAIKKYLLSFGKRKLSQSGEKNIDGIQGNNARKRTTNQWFETQDSISYWDDFNKPKMIWKRIGSKLRFCLDTQGFYCLDSTCIATGSCISFLVALLNTTMGNYLLKDSPKTGTGDLIVSVQALLPIKVPRLSQKDQKEYESLLASIIECINNDQDYKSYERKLESLAFQMYGLTDTEKEYVIQTVNELYR